MKVKVADRYQVIDKDGKVVGAGQTAELGEAEAKAAIANGWATRVKKAKPKK